MKRMIMSTSFSHLYVLRIITQLLYAAQMTLVRNILVST